MGSSLDTASVSKILLRSWSIDNERFLLAICSFLKEYDIFSDMMPLTGFSVCIFDGYGIHLVIFYTSQVLNIELCGYMQDRERIDYYSYKYK